MRNDLLSLVLDPFTCEGGTRKRGVGSVRNRYRSVAKSEKYATGDISSVGRDPGVRLLLAEAAGDNASVAERDRALAALHSSAQGKKRIYARPARK